MRTSGGSAVKVVLIGIVFLCLSTGFTVAEEGFLVGVDCDSPPFVYKDDESEVCKGFDIDLFAAISRIVGFQYTIQPMTFLEILPAVQVGQIDIGLSGITITDARKKTVDFSAGYYLTGIGVMVPKESSIEGVRDLVGRKVGVKTGTVSVAFVNRNATRIELILYPDHATMLTDLVAGHIDAMMCDESMIDAFLHGTDGATLKRVGEVYAERSYGIAFPKGSKLVRKVDNALARLRETGEYETIYRKWFATPPLY